MQKCVVDGPTINNERLRFLTKLILKSKKKVLVNMRNC